MPLDLEGDHFLPTVVGLPANRTLGTDLLPAMLETIIYLYVCTISPNALNVNHALV